MKISRFLFTASIICSIFLSSCKKESNPVDPPVVIPPDEIMTIQENTDSLLTILLTKIDTAKARDSIVTLLLKMSSVKNAVSGEQGVSVEYKNGMKGLNSLS